MPHGLILIVIAVYFIALLAIAFYTSRGAGNESFFIGKKNSNWLLVAYGMIGTSLSGITFMSVPGKVAGNHFFYLQIVIGYLIGYAVVAKVLMPLYYKMNVVSIYSYLQNRFGNTAYKTGASFFILSRTLGASLRIYLVLYVLQKFLLDDMNINFFVTAFVILALILLYTFQGGVKTIVWTDTLQTTFMILSLVVTIAMINKELGFSFGQLLQKLSEKGYAQLFNTDFKSPAFFMKQIISGAFITIAMTGLDQEMMQKNISIRTLGKAQQNMFTFSGILLVVNLLFLVLGGALYVYASEKGIALTQQSDDTFPFLALNYLPPVAGIFFIVGLISALFPSADGAMTALTSSFCIDILNFNKRSDLSEARKMKKRKMVHLTVAFIFFLIILIFKIINKMALIDLVLEVAGYTYGPLLGLFAFGIFTRRIPSAEALPWICIAAPVLTYFLKLNSAHIFNGYQIGFEILPINGIITFLGLWLSSTRKETAALKTGY
jgi:SSS family transporter